MDFRTLTQAMLRPEAYGHPVGAVQRIETHISEVFLSGDFAYKLRKPIRLDFLDFSTAGARRADCENELRLNRRLAPGLYLDVVPIVADGPATVRVGGKGDVVELAVKMRRFEQCDVLLNMAANGRLDGAVIDALAVRVARFHHALPAADAVSGFGTPTLVRTTFEDCAESVVRLSGGSAVAIRTVDMMRTRAMALEGAFAARLRGGHVREGHGDLHLGNIVMIEGEPTPFDCLEFDPHLRWSDTIYDAGFLFMDLIAKGCGDLAWRFVSAYLEESGDYAALVLLPFYAALRALVRARVMLETAHQKTLSLKARTAADGYLALSFDLASGGAGRLLLMHGVSGSGKSTVAARLVEKEGAIRVRSDVERKRLREERMPPPGGWYADGEVHRVYRRMLAICRLGLSAGMTMIADATFLSRHHRKPFLELGQRLGVPVMIVHCDAEVDELRRRILARERQGYDASEAGLVVLEQQLRTLDVLDDNEVARSVSSEAFVTDG